MTATADKAVKERPILFSGPMVLAILDNRKSMTRRIVKPQPMPTGELQDAGPWLWLKETHGPATKAVSGCVDDVAFATELASHCPYGQPGECLWVREKWLPFRHDHIMDGKRYAYAADSIGNGDSDSCRVELGYKWRPSIHMPRAASRLTLEITGVRVERVQDISEDDAVAEGVDAIPVASMPRQAVWTRRHDFSQVWNIINGKGSWESNPWVWAITFRRVSPSQPADSENQ